MNLKVTASSGLAALTALWLIHLADAATPPQLVVPRCDVPPTIDGRIHAGEWKRAAAAIGFIDFRTRHLDPRQVVAFITYDDSRIYLAFQLPIYPQGATLHANHSRRDQGWGDDDIVEILLDPHFSNYDAEDSYYQFMGNFKGHVLLDQATSPGLGLYDQVEWDGQWEFKNQLVDGRWEAELSIPLGNLGIESIQDGDRWLAHFSRSWGGALRYTWTTLSPVAAVLNTPGGGAEITFQSDAPAVRILDVKPLFNGRFGFSGEIANGSQAKSIKIEARCLSAGKTVISKTVSMSVQSGEVLPFSVDEPAQLGESNELLVNVMDADTGVVYHHLDAPFHKQPVYAPVPDEQTEQQLVFESRYLPSRNCLWIDEISFHSLPEKSEISSARLLILHDNVMIGQHEVMLDQNGATNFAVDLPALSDGDCTARLVLLNVDARELASAEKTFQVRDFEFVNSKAGLAGDIVPPFIPITVSEDCVSVLDRQYTFDDLGMLRQVAARQAEPTVGDEIETILHSPVEMTARLGTEEIRFQPSGLVKVSMESPGLAVVQGSGHAGDLDISIVSHVEPDGVVRTEMTLIPKSPTKVDGLCLRIPLRDSQATLLHEVTDTIRRNFAGAVPPGHGVVWDSSRLRNTRGMLGTFKPMYWLGNEDRGLCWFADGEESWSLDDLRPSQEVIRESGCVVLKVNFINKPTELSQPRTISFGLQATPVKPLPTDWRKWLFLAWGEHKSPPGMKYFTVIGSSKKPFHAVEEEGCPYPQPWDAARERIDRHRRDNDSVYLLYQQVQFIAQSLKEYPVFKDEWLRVDCYGADSYHDFRAWALDGYLKGSGLHAFYDDNAYLTPLKDPAHGYGYVRGDGEFQGEFAVSRLRDYFKRLASVYHENEMPNYVGVHKSSAMLPPCFSYVTFAIDGEQRFMTAPSPDYVDQFPLDFVRAHIMGRQFGVVPVFLSEVRLQEDRGEKAARSMYAILLLHEIPDWPGYMPGRDTMWRIHKIKSEFGFGEPDVSFHPYWGGPTHPLARADSDHVEVSLWRRPGRALAVAANLGEETTARITLNLGSLGFKPRSVHDAESGDKVIPEGDKLLIQLPRHDFRLLWLE